MVSVVVSHILRVCLRILRLGCDYLLDWTTGTLLNCTEIETKKWSCTQAFMHMKPFASRMKNNMFHPDAQPSQFINQTLVDQLAVRMPNPAGQLYNSEPDAHPVVQPCLEAR